MLCVKSVCCGDGYVHEIGKAARIGAMMNGKGIILCVGSLTRLRSMRTQMDGDKIPSTQGQLGLSGYETIRYDTIRYDTTMGSVTP